MPDKQLPPELAALEQLLPAPIAALLLKKTDRVTFDILWAMLPQIPVIAQTLNISTIGLILAIITRGKHGRDNRIPVAELETKIPIHLAARRASLGVAFVANINELSSAGSDALLPAMPETMSGNYAKEPCAATAHPATAFLVSPKYAVTAGHVVCSRNPTNLRLIFGFAAPCRLSTDQKNFLVPKKNVVAVHRVIALRYDQRLGDIALLELKQRVPSGVGTPLQLAPQESTKLLQEVAALSHARGQPMKAIIRTKSTVKECFSYPILLDQDRRYIGTNLDTYRGSSGSPVIDSLGRVVGVQVRGLADQSGGHEIPYAEHIAGSWATRIDLLSDALAGIGINQMPA